MFMMLLLFLKIARDYVVCFRFNLKQVKACVDYTVVYCT